MRFVILLTQIQCVNVGRLAVSPNTFGLDESSFIRDVPASHLIDAYSASPGGTRKVLLERAETVPRPCQTHRVGGGRQ